MLKIHIIIFYFIISLQLNNNLFASSKDEDFVAVIANHDSYLKIGDTIRNFQLQIGNEITDFNKIAKGKYVYIDFWNDKSETTTSNKLMVLDTYKHFACNSIAFISIYVGNTSAVWQQKSKKYKIYWYNAFVEDETNLAKWFNLEVLPCGVLINDKGIIQLTNLTSIDDRYESNTIIQHVYNENKHAQNIFEPNADTFNSITTLHIKSKNAAMYKLLINEKVFIDTIQSVNVIKQHISEPLRVCIMNYNDTIAMMNHSIDYINFYLDIGIHDIVMDLDKSAFTSKSSVLTRENNEFWQLKKKNDSLISLLTQNEKANDGLNSHDNMFDSVSHLYHRAYYNKCMSLPKSFMSLKFVQFLTDSYLQGGISKQEVIALFNCLDSSLFNYPSYIETKKIIEANFLNIKINQPTDKINKPLFNTK